MEEPRIIKTTIEFVCPHCDLAQRVDLVADEDVWIEISEDTVDVYTYLQCQECGDEWEILWRQLKIF
ncbi:MAG: hypothetical protein ACFFCW_14375 [Candidatus Hodarchaeota archaeon]